LNIEDMKKIASAAIAVADDISVESDRLRTFCFKVVDAKPSASGDFEVITLDGEKAKVSYLEMRPQLIALAESIPTKVPETEAP